VAIKKKRDLIKGIGITVFVIVALVTVLQNHFGLFDPDTEIGTDCYVDFIDCGQGDSSLLVSDGVVTLIDASTRSEGEKVVDHLKKRGIEKINHFVLTHPHEDHIGGALVVLEAFDVENIYMKRPTAGTEPTSSVYINLLKKIKELGMMVHAVKPEDTFESGAFDMTIFGPVDEYKDLNDQSIVLRAEYGKVSFIFTGDQEIPAEEELVSRFGKSLHSNVLKVGHHGSSTSSGNVFLDAVAPEYAVISCGIDNSYGHPHKETISRFKKRNITYFRTDEMGTITFYTDGETIKEGTR